MYQKNIETDYPITWENIQDVMLLSVLKKKYFEAKKLANKKKKKLAFLIGNTIKSNKSNYYFIQCFSHSNKVILSVSVFFFCYPKQIPK